MPVTLECAGNGRALMEPRPISQPWLTEAVGTGEWTGVRLRDVLGPAGVRDDAVEILFTGLDRGIEGGVEQAYERSLPLAEALGDDALLAYALNGEPLPPQHGFPLRLVIAGWYGMAHVKWLAGITRAHRAVRRLPADDGLPPLRRRRRRRASSSRGSCPARSPSRPASRTS